MVVAKLQALYTDRKRIAIAKLFALAQAQKERQYILSTYFFNYNDVSQFYVDIDLCVFDYMKKIFVVISSIIFMVTQILGAFYMKKKIIPPR